MNLRNYFFTTEKTILLFLGTAITKVAVITWCTINISFSHITYFAYLISKIYYFLLLLVLKLALKNLTLISSNSKY